MRNVIAILVCVLFIVVPFVASAACLGYGDLNVSPSGPTGGGYYLDYDGVVASSSFGYEDYFNGAYKEVFCVSGQNGNGGTYDFYTIDSDLDTTFGSGSYAALSQAAWIADNWMNYTFLESNLDILKGEAQKAVWEVRGVMSIMGDDGADVAIYEAMIANWTASYDTSNWLFAYSPSGFEGTDYQDYLTPNPVPIPVPLYLLGTGLLGLWGIRRRKS